MRKLIGSLFAVGTLAIAACSGESGPPPAPKPSQSIKECLQKGATLEHCETLEKMFTLTSTPSETVVKLPTDTYSNEYNENYTY